LAGLHWFLSFCNGRWTGPILPVGYDDDSNPVFHEWGLPRIQLHRTVRSWFSNLDRNIAPEVYLGFARRWSDDTWWPAIKNSIYWYMPGNASGAAIENTVILSHVAFETISWTLFVEDKKIMSVKKFGNLNAAERLRCLLKHCDIPLQVPAELSRLAKAAKTENWSDGPQSVTAIRNDCIHPDEKNSDQLSRVGMDAEREASSLCLYYLELILLRLFDYEGVFLID